MVQGVGFVIAGRLALGNSIVTRAGPPLKLAKIEWQQGKRSVYNFEVEEDHTYFVGSANGGLWVHNADPCFGNSAKLNDHFARHGADFGSQNAATYEKEAGDFLSGVRDPATLSKVRVNGDSVLYNPNTDQFGVITNGGVIKTYYKPIPAVHGHASNLDYFHAQ